jgi:uroporphyrinogen-III synthase
VDVVTLTSASTARNYSDLVDKYALPIPPVVACIGPETARVAVIKGLPVHVIAAVHTVEGLLDAIDAYLPLEDL